MKLDWDSPLPENLIIKWEKTLKRLQRLQPVHIPRFYFHNLNYFCNVELHGFCDASCKAYAAVVYIRAISADGTVSTEFVASKTKIAPIAKKTIPRLELLSCLILSRLLKTIIDSLNSFMFKIFAWTDSMDCLYWINHKNKVWDRFVQNRVIEIRGNLSDIKWQHCPGELNPADLPSRGLDLNKSDNLSKWLNGPEFLCLDENRWPTGNLSNKKWQHCPGDEGNLPNENGSSVFEGVLDNSNTNNNQTGNEVMKISTLVAETSNDTCSIDQIILINNYNSLRKLLNITSYVCRSLII